MYRDALRTHCRVRLLMDSGRLRPGHSATKPIADTGLFRGRSRRCRPAPPRDPVAADCVSPRALGPDGRCVAGQPAGRGGAGPGAAAGGALERFLFYPFLFSRSAARGRSPLPVPRRAQPGRAEPSRVSRLAISAALGNPNGPKAERPDSTRLVRFRVLAVEVAGMCRVTEWRGAWRTLAYAGLNGRSAGSWKGRSDWRRRRNAVRGNRGGARGSADSRASAT